MRIIAGELKGREVSLPKNSRTRPVSSYVLEQAMNLFNAYNCELGERLPGGAFLDICSGSGLVGFEALSRGAQRVIFVEADGDTARNLSQTIERFGVRDRAVVLRMDARKCVNTVQQRLLEGELLSAVFLDPPFIAGMAGDVMTQFARGLELLGPGALLTPDALLIIRSEDDVPTKQPALDFLEMRQAGGRSKMWLFEEAQGAPEVQSAK